MIFTCLSQHLHFRCHGQSAPCMDAHQAGEAMAFRAHLHTAGREEGVWIRCCAPFSAGSSSVGEAAEVLKPDFHWSSLSVLFSDEKCTGGSKPYHQPQLKTKNIKVTLLPCRNAAPTWQPSCRGNGSAVGLPRMIWGGWKMWVHDIYIFIYLLYWYSNIYIYISNINTFGSSGSIRLRKLMPIQAAILGCFRYWTLDIKLQP